MLEAGLRLLTFELKVSEYMVMMASPKRMVMTTLVLSTSGLNVRQAYTYITYMMTVELSNTTNLRHGFVSVR